MARKKRESKMNNKKYHLIKTELPDFGQSKEPSRAKTGEYKNRLLMARSFMERLGLTHLIVYGDREHFSNLFYLTGYDPRFEEAILIINKEEIKPLILVGNEGKSYINISPMYKSEELRSECFQPFSLLDQPRDDSRKLKDILAGEGINKGSTVGCAGWKYFSDMEQPDGRHAIDIPSYIVDTARDLASFEDVINAATIFMNPDDGLKTFCSPSEIAYFEYTNALSSEGFKAIFKGIHDGITDYELLRLAKYNGEPLSCHMVISTKNILDCGFPSPCGNKINLGEPLLFAINYWGSCICRAGWMASSSNDLPENARNYLDDFAGIYFEAAVEWYSRLRIGANCGDIAAMIHERLPFEKFNIFLNPGHLIHLDEWVSSPFYIGSKINIHSGMYIQADIIPSSDIYFSTRLEEGIIIADKNLRQGLKKNYPDCYRRCQERRDFMMNVLGFELPEEILPLSNIPGIVSPFFLDPDTVFTVR